MSVREWVNQHAAVVTVALIGVLVLLLAVLFFQVGGRGMSGYSPDDVYYLDVGAGDVFVEAGGRTPPIEAPSGGEGVRAHLFTCGQCEAEEWFGYVERYTEQGRLAMEDPAAAGMRVGGPEHQAFLEANHQVRPLEGGSWVRYTSRDGERVMAEVHGRRCDDGSRPRQCTPAGPR